METHPIAVAGVRTAVFWARISKYCYFLGRVDIASISIESDVILDIYFLTEFHQSIVIDWTLVLFECFWDIDWLYLEVLINRTTLSWVKSEIFICSPPLIVVKIMRSSEDEIRWYQEASPQSDLRLMIFEKNCSDNPMGEIDDRFLRHQNRTFITETKLIFDLLSILLFVFAAFSSHFIKNIIMILHKFWFSEMYAEGKVKYILVKLFGR